jgi:Uncharacterised nucleotidyltransferase
MAKHTIRPEDEMLLCCARTHMSPDIAGRVRDLLREAVDWDYFIRAASAHGVKPLVCQNLGTIGLGIVPETVRGQLRRYIQAHSLKNLLMTRELIKLFDLLEKKGISAIPWKGPVLAAAAYGNVALRQFTDLDILVREQDAMRAKDLLFASGYRPLYQQPADQEAAYYGLRKVYELVREDDRVVVELHWAITSRTFPFPLDPASLWVEAETVSLEGTPVRNLGPADLLLVLCVHGAKHHWGKLMWICDIAELLRVYSQKIDWTRLMNRARGLGGMRMLSLGLLLARDLLGAKMPVDVLEEIKGEPRIAFLAGEVRSQLFSGGSLMAVERPTFYIQLRERAQDRMRCRLYLAYRMLAPSAQAWTLRLVHSSRSVRHFLHRRLCNAIYLAVSATTSL